MEARGAARRAQLRIIVGAATLTLPRFSSR
jgi:hypothetical protein